VKHPDRYPVLIPLIALAFTAVHLILEHFTGGVLSHHLFNNPDLPAISNWLELITLPVLGVVLGQRVRTHPSSKRRAGIPVPVLTALLGAILYGAVLAASFSLGAETITSAAFLGLIVCGFVLPVYRVEYILGFVAGMTFTIGGILPLLFALVVAAVSFTVRPLVSRVGKAIRARKTQSGRG